MLRRRFLHTLAAGALSIAGIGIVPRQHTQIDDGFTFDYKNKTIRYTGNSPTITVDQLAEACQKRGWCVDERRTGLIATDIDKELLKFMQDGHIKL